MSLMPAAVDNATAAAGVAAYGELRGLLRQQTDVRRCPRGGGSRIAAGLVRAASWSAAGIRAHPCRGVQNGRGDPDRRSLRRVPHRVEFTLELQLRNDDEMFEVPWELHHRHRGRRSADEDLPDDFMRFGVLFADGSSWSNVDAVFPSPSEPPTGPLVMSRGGGGGGGSWVMNQWLWPLPPDGSLTFIAEWPKYHVDESRATVDAGRIREAVTQVEDLWTQ